MILRTYRSMHPVSEGVTAKSVDFGLLSYKRNAKLRRLALEARNLGANGRLDGRDRAGARR